MFIINFAKIYSNTEFLSRYRRGDYQSPEYGEQSSPLDDVAKTLVITCYETVQCTVSPKFTSEFGATCLLCFAQFTLQQFYLKKAS